MPVRGVSVFAQLTIRAEDGGEDQKDDTQAAAEAALLHFPSPRDAATIAAFLRTRVYLRWRVVVTAGEI
ncbi:hypothetical protein ACNPQM_42815 [Streptomyces sp. NPDC056231]|uniref:hypothetical protein n=1 Tax=Streptomyces sp. NPDC056231 TaxID=3345755 RepID=UPI003AAD4C70